MTPAASPAARPRQRRGGGARLAPAALGTDTGASVRLPAALNGVAGFRPSVGRYDGAGITPISHTRDTPGPLAASMEDIALLDAILAGEDQPAQTLPVAGLRLGLPSVSGPGWNRKWNASRGPRWTSCAPPAWNSSRWRRRTGRGQRGRQHAGLPARGEDRSDRVPGTL